MSIAHGIRRAGVIGAGQMGTSWVAHALSLTLTLPCTGLGIAFVSAVHAKVPVLLHDRSSAQVKSELRYDQRRQLTTQKLSTCVRDVGEMVSCELGRMSSDVFREVPKVKIYGPKKGRAEAGEVSSVRPEKEGEDNILDLVVIVFMPRFVADFSVRLQHRIGVVAVRVHTDGRGAWRRGMRRWGGGRSG